MFKTIKTPEQIEAEQAEQARVARIAELKKLLAETDYIALPDYDGHKPDVIAQRQAWREEIRALKP
jgi:hypothetical protein